MSDNVNDYGMESADMSTGAASRDDETMRGGSDDVDDYGMGAPNTQTGEAAQRVGTGVPGDGDDVNEYGLGSPNTQSGEAGHRVADSEDEPSGLVHGLGPADGPFVGESASEEEGVRYQRGTGDTMAGDTVYDDTVYDTATGDAVNQPGAVPERRDPLERGKDSSGLP